MSKTDTVLTLIEVALRVSQMWADYAERAKAMTREEALREWHRVQARAVEARTRWETAGDA